MDFSNISSVNELLEANEQPAEAKMSVEAVYQLCLDNLSMEGATKLAATLVEQLACYHQNTRTELIEAGEAEKAALWAFDECLLAQALNALKSVTVD